MAVGFCEKSASVIQIIGYVLLVFKIVVPIIIIIVASIDLSKAVMSGEEKDIKEQGKKLLIRFLLGALIFILPSIVNVVYFSLANDEEVSKAADACITCLTTPGKCDVSSEPTILK